MGRYPRPTGVQCAGNKCFQAYIRRFALTTMVCDTPSFLPSSLVVSSASFGLAFRCAITRSCAVGSFVANAIGLASNRSIRVLWSASCAAHCCSSIASRRISVLLVGTVAAVLSASHWFETTNQTQRIVQITTIPQPTRHTSSLISHLVH